MSHQVGDASKRTAPDVVAPAAVEAVLAEARCRDVHRVRFEPPFCDVCRSWAQVAAAALVAANLTGGEAAAWDRGYTSGHSNAMRRMSDEPNAPTTPNPYLPAPAQAEKGTWGHWCYDQVPTELPTTTPRCPQCGALLGAHHRPEAETPVQHSGGDVAYSDDGLREAVAEGIAGTQKPCRKALVHGGCQIDYGSCYCLDTADAALAVVGPRLDAVTAERDAWQTLAEARRAAPALLRADRDHFEAEYDDAVARIAALAEQIDRVKALADECAASGCIHLNDLWGRLRAALDGVS